MLGKNIKVHFAGSDGEPIFDAALKCANVKYRLYTCYPYIVKKRLSDDFTLPEDHIIRKQDCEMNHVIQDSGLFSLMFGRDKGKKQTRETLTIWQDKLIKFVLQNNLKATCVDIDCQKILGVEDAWFFRRRMRDLLPNKQINVFHFEDGKKGLDQLIEFTDYIAISVPELRIIKPKTYAMDTTRLVDYIKNRKPEIDIHLLGCTQFSILKENTHCTSADSTSWLQGVKYGYISDGQKKQHIKTFKKELVEERKKQVLRIVRENNLQLKEKTLTYTVAASISATICKQRYTAIAGDQN